jgi:hypothetical protein
MQIVRTLSFAWCLLAASHASAFNVDGFHTGMTLEEVRKITEKYGVLQRMDKDMYLANNPLRTYTSFNFCKTKLVSLQQDQPANFKQLSLLIAKFNKLHGQPFSVKAGSGPDPTGEINEIRIGWRVGSEYVSVYYKGSTQAESLSTSYQAKNTCFQVPR